MTALYPGQRDPARRIRMTDEPGRSHRGAAGGFITMQEATRACSA